MLAYLIIVGTSVLGYVGAPWWSLLCGAAALGLVGNRELLPLRARFVAVGAPHLLVTATHSRIAQSVLAALVAFGWGALRRTGLGG
jgi:hypothetical protein